MCQTCSRLSRAIGGIKFTNGSGTPSQTELHVCSSPPVQRTLYSWNIRFARSPVIHLSFFHRARIARPRAEKCRRHCPRRSEDSKTRPGSTDLMCGIVSSPCPSGHIRDRALNMFRVCPCYGLIVHSVTSQRILLPQAAHLYLIALRITLPQDDGTSFRLSPNCVVDHRILPLCFNVSPPRSQG
ncbi:hypothetical protein OBBRIDRAFT_213921 [Obba rivulosa]|uniref:Uncharacterized protein n=1 Tax=Obba rivulosa TaxID=1052685 RepID=A0A8E2AR71_9APHY|nr:hypothetical protein OBBRIDRAFT_213921 [Obba rivulosa]